MAPKGDVLDKDRAEFNKVLRANINMGTNNIVTDKMFVYTTKMDDMDEALKDLHFKGTEFEDRFKELGCDAHVMNGKERLETIHNMFSPAQPFYFDYDKVNETFTTKDAIAPTSFDFTKKDRFMIGNRFCRCLWLKNYSTELSDKYIYHNHINMMPGSKGLNPHELAHRWMKDLGTRPDMSIKVG